MTDRTQPNHLLSPAALYGLVGAVAFFQCLFLGRSYFDDDLLIYVGVSWKFLQNSLAAGHIPLWNPYWFGGQPFWPDPGAMVTYPLLYPCLLFPVGYGISLFLFFHFILAATGMHQWLKNLGLSRNACFVGGLTFSLSGFFWGEVIHPPCLASFTWTAWFLASLEGTLTQRSLFPALMGGFSLAFLFLAGYPQMFLGTLAFGALYFLFRLYQKRKIAGPGSGIKGLLVLWGLLPLLCLAVPFFEFTRFSDRLVVNLDYKTFSANISLMPSHLYQFLFPVHPVPGTSTHEDYIGDSGTIGLWGPFLCLLAFSRKDRRLPLFFTGMGFFILLVCFGKYFPLHQWLCGWVPGLKMLRAPFRFIFITVICLSVLAAFGFDHLESCFFRNKKKVILTASLYGLAVLVGAWSTLSLDRALIAVILGGIYGLCRWGWSRESNPFGKKLFLGLMTLSLLLGGWKSCPSRLGPGSNFDYTKKADLLAKVKSLVGGNRVFVGDNIPYDLGSNGEKFKTEFPTNAACLFGLRNAGAYDPLSLLKRGQLHTLPFSVFNRLMAIGGFLTGNEKGQAPGFNRLEEGPVHVYVAKTAPSFVYAPKRIKVLQDEPAQLAAMGMPGFDPYQESILSRDPPPFPLSTLRDRAPNLRYERILDELDHQAYQVRLDLPNWVVFSEPNYPGWKAWVDGKRAEIITSNYLFRGMMVDAGDHRVDLRFEPAWFSLIVFGILLWIPLTSFLVFRIRRKGRPDGL